MSCNQFITNLEGLNNGKDFPKDLLKVETHTYTHTHALMKNNHKYADTYSNLSLILILGPNSNIQPQTHT